MFSVITYRLGLFFSPFSLTASSERMGTLEGEASNWLNIAKTGRVILVLVLYELPHKASRSVQWLRQIAAPMQLLHFYADTHTHTFTVYVHQHPIKYHPFPCLYAGSNLIFLLLHAQAQKCSWEDCALNRPGCVQHVFFPAFV